MLAPMQIFVDSADAERLAPLLGLPFVHGVTTNPALMRTAGLTYDGMPEFVRHVLDAGARSVHVQVKGETVDEMLEEAKAFARWAGPGEVVVKIPATRHGLRALGAAAQMAIPCTATAVYSVPQVLLAVLSGARYAAPYLGRLDDRGDRGIDIVRDMQGCVTAYAGAGSRNLRLLVASVRAVEHFEQLLALGVGAVTLAPDLLEALLEHPATDAAAADFRSAATGL